MLAGIADAASPLTISVNGASGAAAKQGAVGIVEMSATVGQSISTPLQTSASSQSSQWAVTAGSIPTGLSLSNTGLLAGKPSTAGFWHFTIGASATEGQPKPAAQTIAFAVLPAALTVTTGSLPNGVSGTAYSVTLQANGGKPSYIWTLVSGKLPAGLSLSRSGVISGTPTTPGSSNFALGVNDSAVPMQRRTNSYSLTIQAPALAIVSGSLGSAPRDTAYSASLSATGGTPAYRWSLTSGSLPAGLSLSGAGVISGTPASAGTFNFGISVGDSGTPTQSQTRGFSLTVVPPALVISTGSLINAQAGAAYTASLVANGGTPAYAWSSASGPLPSGLTLSPTGNLSGVPATAGTFNFSVAVSDAGYPAQQQTRSFTLIVAPSALSINAAALRSGQNGAAYTASFAATGGTPAYTWTLASGSLPAGLTLGSSGNVTGTPTTVGISTFTVAVNDASAPSQRQTQNVSLTIAPAVLAITSGSLSNGQAGTAYNANLTATGGTPSYSWSLASGSLPAGLMLSSAGTVGGTPTGAGTSTFTVALVDQSNPSQRQTKSLSIAIGAAPLNITSSTLANAQPSASYNTALQANGGTPGYSWSLVLGNLPAGISLSSSGILSGTASPAAQTTAFVAQVADASNPAQTALKSFTLFVAPGVAITSTSLANGQLGSAYSTKLNAAGGTPAYTWSIASGSLPAGLTLSSTGVLSGTPQAAGNSSFTVAVADSSSPALQQTANLTLSITSGLLSITSASLSNGQTGSAYNAGLLASGGTPSYTWSLRSGSLPAGLSLAATTGVISGTPSAGGSTSFTVAVSDNSNPAQVQTATTSITITKEDTSAVHTWYVRPDGGTRYSDRITTGQCDGKSDAPYPGSGVNQSCAFSDVRYFWTDAGYCVDSSATSTCWKWIGSGGDTYLIRGSLANGATYRIGQNGPGSHDTFGLNGNPYASGAPVPPSGTSSAHTRILGENFGSCSVPSAKTQLHGGYGTSQVLNLTGASYVDVACLDITDFSACGRSAQTNGCHTSYPLDDYANNGILLSNQTNHVTLSDIRVHGMASSGLLGPTGDGVVMTGLELVGNASSGWNADAGDGQTGTGSVLVQKFNISWNGCAEEYPLVDALPYNDCTDDLSGGGYGDGFGTATVPSIGGWKAQFDQGLVSYNTQDGLDALHLIGSGSSMTITRVLAYGNMGQQIKVGGASGTATNNVLITNCNALRQSIPGTPAGYNSRLSDFCRAADEGILFTVGKGSTGHFDFNTIYSASATGIDIQCDLYAGACDSSSAMTYRNNIFIGFKNDSSSGYPAGRGSGDYSNPIYLASFNPFANAGSAFSNNITYHPKSNWTCPATGLNEASGLCADPVLTDESWHLYGFGDVTPLPNNAARGAGAAIPGVTTDYTGATRKAVPSIGAYD